MCTAQPQRGGMCIVLSCTITLAPMNAVYAFTAFGICRGSVQSLYCVLWTFRTSGADIEEYFFMLTHKGFRSSTRSTRLEQTQQ